MFDKTSLPNPAIFYLRELGCLKGSGEWKMARCCFHQDKQPSLAVNIDHGGYFCHGCGASGGSLIDFVRHRDSCNFRDACRRLGVWCEGS